MWLPALALSTQPGQLVMARKWTEWRLSFSLLPQPPGPVALHIEAECVCRTLISRVIHLKRWIYCEIVWRIVDCPMDCGFVILFQVRAWTSKASLLCSFYHYGWNDFQLCLRRLCCGERGIAFRHDQEGCWSRGHFTALLLGGESPTHADMFSLLWLKSFFSRCVYVCSLGEVTYVSLFVKCVLLGHKCKVKGHLCLLLHRLFPL